jgi:hypothetical protein
VDDEQDQDRRRWRRPRGPWWGGSWWNPYLRPQPVYYRAAPAVSPWRWDAARAVWWMPGYPLGYSPALRAWVRL